MSPIISGTILCAAILSVCVVDAQLEGFFQRRHPEFTVGTRAKRPQRDDAVSATPFACPVDKAGLMCSDCQTRALCIDGSTMPRVQQKCVDIDASKPFCVANECTDTPNATDPTCSSGTFSCTGSGIYPDPTDCTVYHQCSAVGGQATLMQCPTGYTFDARQQQCRRRDSPLQCRRLNCARVANGTGLAAYRLPSPYYAFCVGGAKSQMVIFRCPDVENQQFNAATGRCEYECKRRGSFADRTDCTAYQMCEWKGGQLKATQVQCPDDYYYSGGSCIPQTATKCVPELQS